MGALEQIHPVQKQHVKVDVQVQRRTEALDQRHGPGRGAGAREAGLADEVARDGPLHHAEHLRELPALGVVYAHSGNHRQFCKTSSSLEKTSLTSSTDALELDSRVDFNRPTFINLHEKCRHTDH